MDDPLFDPWGQETSETEPPRARPAARWRAPAPVPTPPVKSEPLEGGRLPGNRGYLRSMAVPRLRSVAHRLQVARHEAALTDLLEGSPPLLRLTMRPWRSLLTRTPPPPWATLEIELEEGTEESIVARMWIEPTVEPAEVVRTTPSRLTAGWLHQVALEFVERVLERLG